MLHYRAYKKKNNTANIVGKIQLPLKQKDSKICLIVESPMYDVDTICNSIYAVCLKYDDGSELISFRKEYILAYTALHLPQGNRLGPKKAIFILPLEQEKEGEPEVVVEDLFPNNYGNDNYFDATLLILPPVNIKMKPYKIIPDNSGDE